MTFPMTDYSDLKEKALAAKPRRIAQTDLGKTGNCMSACLAMLLDISIEDIPNFSLLESDEAAFDAMTAWLQERGYFALSIRKWAAWPWPPQHGFYIAGGPASRGYEHAVVFQNGKMLHDPHPSGEGITAVEDIYFILPLGVGAYENKSLLEERDRLRAAGNALIDDVRKRYNLPSTEKFSCRHMRALEAALKGDTE